MIQISKIEKKFLNDVIPPRALDRRFQEDWTRNAKEGSRILMSFRVDFGPMD